MQIYIGDQLLTSECLTLRKFNIYRCKIFNHSKTRILSMNRKVSFALLLIMLQGLMTNCSLSAAHTPEQDISKRSSNQTSSFSQFTENGQIYYEYNSNVRWLCFNSPENYN